MRRTEQGQALPLAAGAMALAAAVLLGLIGLGSAVDDRARAHAAADAAALAGAAAGRPAAEEAARANGGRLERFAVSGAEAEATVRVDGARATARARSRW